MLYDYQKAPDSPSLGDIALAMSQYSDCAVDVPHAQQVLERMVDEGSRFANLERVLGPGAVFLLCHAGADNL